MRVASLAVILFLFWLALSGHYTPFLIAVGIASSLLCVVAAVRMGIVDTEGHPIALLPRTAFYYPWLAAEIAKSAWTVTRTIVSRDLAVSPTMTTVTASQKTATGIATYANSITLTPGTITVGVSDNELTVHALNHSGAVELEGGAMDRRVTAFEGAD